MCAQAATDHRHEGDDGSYEHRDVLAGHPIEAWISYALRIGVLLAAAIILVGLLVYLFRGPTGTDPRSFSALLHEHASSVSLSGIFRGVADGSGTAIIELGVLVLILTPTVRVGMTLFLFTAEREVIFLVIVSIVFAILLIGLIGVGS